MNIFIQGALLVLGFTLLIKGAGFFVDGASKIADKFGISQIPSHRKYCRKQYHEHFIDPWCYILYYHITCKKEYGKF